MAKRLKPNKPPKTPFVVSQEMKDGYARYRDQFANSDTPPAERPKFASKKSPAVLDCVISWLERGYTVGFAADKANVSRRIVLEWKQEDEDFRARFIIAIERGTDLIEDEARRRAVEGTDEPVFQQGECIGFKRVYSDHLLSMLLPGRRGTYGRNRTEVTGKDGGKIEHNIEVTFVPSKQENE